MKRLNQTGALHIAAVLGVLLVAVVAFAGYRVLTANKSTDDAGVTATSIPATIKTKADLVKTGKALDQTSAQLDASLNDAALDSDINGLL